MYDFTKADIDMKRFTIELSNKNSHVVDGVTKEKIQNSKAQFIELFDGTVINKSFIVEMRFSKEETKKAIRAIPVEERKKLLETIKREDGKKSLDDDIISWSFA